MRTREPRRNRVRMAVAVAACLCVLVAMSACTGIPRTGSVQPGASAASDNSQGLQFLAQGPLEGDSPTGILMGFVDAATSPANGWGVAREFLTQAFSRAWDPTAQVLVDTGDRTASPAGASVGGQATTYELDTMITATVDAHGSYGPVAAHNETLQFTFAKENGQWRISSAPAGIILAAPTFPQVFSQYPVFFFDQTGSRLVPDVRWFPARDSTSTRIVNALLAGPASWLSTTHAAVSSVPSGAVLVADSVPIQDSVASVNFDLKTVGAKTLSIPRMLAQLSASLAGVTGVRSVRVLFSGTDQGILDVPDTRLAIAGVSSGAAFVDTAKGFGNLDENGGVVPLATLSSKIHALNPVAVALNQSTSLAAVLTPAGSVALVSPQTRVRLVDSRSGLIAPVVDVRGFVWSVPAKAPRSIFIATATQARVPLEAPWSGARTLTGLHVSPDGSRVAATYTTAAGSQLCVASIERSLSGRPIRIGDCVNPALVTDTISVSGWVDATRIALVSLTSTGSRVQLVTVGGLTQDQPIAARIMAVGGPTTTLEPQLLSDSGSLYQQVSSTRWSVVATGVRCVGVAQ